MNDYPELVASNADRLHLTELGKKFALEVVSSPPSREPSNRGGNHMIVDFASRKMERTIPCESLSLEGGHARILDSEQSSVVGYWAQPRALPILCTCKGGKKQTLWLTFDFMVLYPDRVELHECKPESECLRLSETSPGRYRKTEEGRWHAPEIESALKEYGITFRIITEADVPTTLVRNLTVLAEVGRGKYSHSNALENLRKLLQRPEGETLVELIGSLKSGGYAKNDIYIAIARNDVFCLLEHSLLVDEKTTRVFGFAHHAMAHRAIRYSSAPTRHAPVIIRAGQTATWNGSTYQVCNVGKDTIYLQSGDGCPIKFDRALLCSLIAAKELRLTETLLPSSADEELTSRFKALSEDQQSLALRKLQFLRFRRRNRRANPKHFDLPPIHIRTLQRWERNAREAKVRFGSEVLGLVDAPRPGRPRDDLPTKLRELATRTSEELYFSPVKRTLSYCWREFRARCKEAILKPMSRTAFTRHVKGMKNTREATEARDGKNAAQKFVPTPNTRGNWLKRPDFPFKFAQIDGKLHDIEVVDEETGENLGRPSTTLVMLPYYGVPIGFSLLLEPPSYRSSTVALRDAYRRFNQLPRHVLRDNGSEFNNANFDKLLALFDITAVNRPVRKPKFASEQESLHRRLDVEVIHNLEGNTKASRNPREQSDETKPKKRAVWTLPAFYDALEEYFFEILWDAPSSSLGTTPRLAIERDLLKAPTAAEFSLPPHLVEIAFFPEVKCGPRKVNPGRGIYVEGYYYWNDKLARPEFEEKEFIVRYDPYDLYRVYLMNEGEAIECEATNAPELRNVTERHRHLGSLAKRALKNKHGEVREETHGRRLTQFSRKLRDTEALLLEKRRDRARQQTTANRKTAKGTPSAKLRPGIPQMDFRHVGKKVA